MSEEPRQVVRSPEQVALHLPVAGPTSRMLAYFIDYLLILLVEIGVLLLLILVFPMLTTTIGRRIAEAVGGGDGPLPRVEAILVVLAMFFVLQLMIEMSYFVFFEMTTGGRSPGKALIGLRVVRDGGLPVGLRESLGRNLLRVVDALPGSYLVGIVALVVSEEGKRLGDLAAGTIVVRLDRVPETLLAPEGAVPPAGFRFDRAQLARIDATALALARGTLRRAADLPPERAALVLARAVEVLRLRLDYPPVEPGEREAFLRALLHAARAR